MLLKISVITFLINLFFSFSAWSQNSFSSFLEKFETVELPYSIEENDYELSLKYNLDALDHANVEKYIEENSEIANGLFLFDVLNYYPIAKFSMNNSIQILIIEKSGGAGGVERRFNLLSYNNDGEILSQIEIAQEIGDCSFLNLKTVVIDKGFIITVENKEYKGICENDIYELILSKISIFKILNSGKIVIVS